MEGRVEWGVCHGGRGALEAWWWREWRIRELVVEGGEN